MKKVWCIWCESGDIHSSNGYYWIHLHCAEKLMDINDDIKAIKEMLQGIHLRNKKDENKLNVVYNFIKDMNDFNKKWVNIKKIIKQKREINC